jgi:hypothetical protein
LLFLKILVLAFYKIHYDLWGPALVLSIGKFKFYACLVNDFWKYTWIIPLKHKSNFFCCISSIWIVCWKTIYGWKPLPQQFSFLIGYHLRLFNLTLHISCYMELILTTHRFEFLVLNVFHIHGIQEIINLTLKLSCVFL